MREPRPRSRCGCVAKPVARVWHPDRFSLGKTATGDRLDIGALVRECGVSVPNIVDKLEATALTDLTAAGLVAGGRSEAYHGTIVAGRVINSTPTAGAMVPPGSTVSYVVSLGIEQVTVPNIVGLTETAADSALTGVGLAPGAKTSAYSTTVAKDLVISQAPAAAATVAQGFDRRLRREPGASSRSRCPNIVGLTETAADSALTGVGLVPGAKTTRLQHHGRQGPRHQPGSGRGATVAGLRPSTTS